MEQINYMKGAALGKKKQPLSYNFMSRWRNQISSSSLTVIVCVK